MAFIGMDGAEHKIRQLTSQLQSKDAELASVRNELIKKSEILAEEIKSKQALQYQMEQDSRGIESSSKDTTSLKNEVSILRQNLTNRETALAGANDTIKKLEKAMSGLEYELQCAGSNSDQSSRRLLETKNKLEVEVKGLKQELQRRDSEEIRLKAAMAKVTAESNMQPPSGIPRLKRPPSRTSTSNFFGSAPTPSPAPSKIPQLSAAAASSSSRRRSTSLSNSRELDLQNKISNLETQLAGTRTKLDKADNQVLAAQRSAKKAVDDLERRLDEANDELEFYRSQDGGKAKNRDSGELEQIRKNRDALKATVEGLMGDLKVARVEIAGLRIKVEQADIMEREREAVQPQQSSISTSISTEEVDALKARISMLELELTKAQSQVELAAPTETDDFQIVADMRKEIRKLKKELSLTQRMVTEAEKERDEFEEELEGLKASGSKKKAVGMVDEAELLAAKQALGIAEKRVAELVEEVESLTGTVEMEKAEREKKVEELRSEVEQAVNALTAAQQDLESLQNILAARDSDLLTSAASSTALKATIQQLESDADARAVEAETLAQTLTERTTELEFAQQRVATLQNLFDAAIVRADEAESQLSALVEVESLLAVAQGEVEQLRGALSEMEALEFGARQERDQARSDRDASQERLMAVESELEAAEEAKKLAISDAEHERATVAATRTELEESKKRLASRLLEIEEYSDQLQIAATDISKLEQRNTELEEGLANRSTESEAQSRQEEVFQLKEDLETLRTQLGDKEVELAKGMEEIRISSEKISELEISLSKTETDTSPSPNSSHVNLLHSKIEKLRIERDELRQTMSFAKHEHRFAIQAAQADRLSAMEELERAKLDLVHRDKEAEKVHLELSRHREQVHSLSTELDGLRGRMAEMSSETHDELDQHIQQLQLELENTKADREQMRESSIMFFSRHGELQREHDQAVERYKDLTEAFQALQGQYSDVQRRVAEAERQRSVALVERDECLEKMDAMRPVETLSSSVNGVTETPAIEGKIRRELRRASSMAFQDHALLEQVKKLEIVEGRLKVEKENVAAEKERVKRRETALASLYQQLKKAEFSAQLARDESDERAEESQSAMEAARLAHQARVEKLEFELKRSTGALEVSRAELEIAQSSLVASEETIKSLNLDIARISEETTSLSAQKEEAISIQQILQSKLDKMSSSVTVSANSSAVLILTLANLQSSLTSTQSILDTDLNHIAELEAKVEVAQTRISVLESERDSLRNAMGSEEQTPRQEMESLFTEQSALKSQIIQLEGKCRGLEGELETLISDLGAAEEAHSGELEEMRAEMREMEVNSTGHRVEMEATLANLIVERLSSRQSAKLAERTMAGMRDQVVQLEIGLSATVTANTLKNAELDSMLLEIEAQKKVIEGMEIEMRTKQVELELAVGAANTERDSAREEMQRAVIWAREKEAEITDLVNTQLAVKGTEVEMRETIETLRAELIESTSSLNLARSDLESLQKQVDQRESDREAELGELEARLAESSAALVSVNIERIELERSLRMEIASLGDKVDASLAKESELTTRAEEGQLRAMEEGKKRADLEIHMKEVLGSADKEKEVAEQMRLRLVDLEAKLSDAEGMMVEQRDLSASLSSQVETTRNQLADLQAKLDSASTRLDEKQEELNSVMLQNVELNNNQLSAPSAERTEAIEDLENQLQELTAICQSKDNDVDVATDQMTAAVVDRNKALVKIGKLERRIAKLEKIIKEVTDKEETAKNTAKNLVLMKPTLDDLIMAPPPLPTSTPSTSRPTSIVSTPNGHPLAPIPTPTTQSINPPAESPARQPLRNVNVFDKSQMPASFSSLPQSTPKIGTKRSREGDSEDSKPLPADAIMLPPAIIPPGSARKPSVKPGFTPQRNAFAPLPGSKENSRPIQGAVGSGGKGNVFAESTPKRNPFAID